MVRKKDHFWEYVEELDGRFKCNFCGREFAGGAPRIKSHLAGVKGRDIDICTKVRDDVQAKAYLAIGGHSKMPKITSNSSNVEQSKEVSTSMSNDLHQTTILEMCKKKDNGHGYKSSNQHSVDKLLTQHIILNNISFNVVQTPAFIRFVQGVAEYGHGYKLPSYSTLRTKLIPNSRIEVEEYISNVKKSWVTTGCTLMSDIWSDMKQRAFVNIIAYSPRGAVFMRSIDVSQERKTEFFLKQIISAVIEEIGPNHVVQFITDNATNFESAGDMLIGKYPHLYKTRCAAHGIQLLLKDIYEEVNWVQKVIDDAKSIVAYMYKHTIVLSLMRAHTNNKELKHPCTTRFASNFLMLQSILNVESELQLLVASSDWSGLDYSKKDIAKEVTNIIQSTEFWSQGHEVLLVLEPLVRVLRLVDGDGSTAGYLYEAMERAREAIQQRCGNNQEKYIRMWELFEGRRTQNIIHPIHCAAAFLNPAYMYSGTFTENREMKEGISFILENLVAPEEKREFMGQVQLYRMKLSCLFTETAMTMLKTSHPRIWWDYCGDSLPVLKKYAIRILSQPCSSSSCERNWSAFEAAQTKKRNRLTPKMLDDLVYVRMNTMMMEKFNTLEARDVELIDLDKLNELPEHEYVSQEQDTENDKLAEEVENINDDVIDDTDLSCSNEMGTSQNVELEAAKFLQKLIQDNKDEPAKLATKLYVILQHMKSRGYEHSMPYQVISREIETIINQHGLDIEALRLSHLPLSGGNQIGDSATAQFAGSSQAGGVANDSKVGFAENEVSKVDPFASNRPPVGPSSAGHDYYQGSLAHRSANSQSQERQQKDGKEATTKRKRGEASLPMEQHIDNTQQLDTWNAVVNPRKGKMNKVEPQASLSVKGGERTNFNMVPSSGQMEHFASLSGSIRPMLRVNQEGQHAIERQLDSSNISNSMLRAPNPKFPEEVEVSSAHNASQQGGSLPSHDIRGVWNQNKTGLPFEKSQIPRFPSNVPGNMMSEIPTQQSTTPSLGSGKYMEYVSAFKLWI